MANRYMKRYSASLLIRDTEIKTMKRYDLIPVRMTMIKKTRNNKCWEEYEEMAPLFPTVGGNVNWCSQYRTTI